jgi:hypothetical protein
MFLVVPEVWAEEFLFATKQTVERKAVKQGVRSVRTKKKRGLDQHFEGSPFIDRTCMYA